MFGGKVGAVENLGYGTAFASVVARASARPRDSGALLYKGARSEVIFLSLLRGKLLRNAREIPRAGLKWIRKFPLALLRRFLAGGGGFSRHLSRAGLSRVAGLHRFARIGRVWRQKPRFAQDFPPLICGGNSCGARKSFRDFFAARGAKFFQVLQLRKIFCFRIR